LDEYASPLSETGGSLNVLRARINDLIGNISGDEGERQIVVPVMKTSTPRMFFHKQDGSPNQEQGKKRHKAGN
jgi:hypothetical protein